MKSVMKNTLLYLFYAFVCATAVCTVIFSVFILKDYAAVIAVDAKIIQSVVVGAVSSLTVLTLLFYGSVYKLAYKICLLLLAFCAIVSAGFYFLSSSGILDKIDGVEDLRQYISSFGGNAVVLFILVQFLQVVVLPIPSFITVGAGVLLFGPLKGAVYSCIGIIAGSLFAFFLGKTFGFKVAKWLVGEDGLKKGLKVIKGKDKVVLTFMFLFPFFPDDVLCFVAGITTVSPLYFTVMIVIVRIITVFTSCYSINNSIIPYDTWWGILLWVLFFAVTVFLTVVVYKNGEKIEDFFKKKLKKVKRKNR